MTLPQPGEVVSYYLIPKHACDGGECTCPETETKVYDAVVIARAIDADPDSNATALVLDVALGEEEIKLGYLRRQSHAPFDGGAALSPARSGYWRYRS